MDTFLLLLFNMLPLYGIIALGFIAGRWLKVDRGALANMVLYIFLPIIVFGFVVKMDFQPSYIALPFVVLIIQTVIGLSFLWIGRRIYSGAEANILAMSASMGNTGYFGLPLALMLFTTEQVAIYIFALLGGAMYEATIGYYIAARGRFDMKTSLLKLARFPTIYAIAAAFIARSFNFELTGQPELYWQYFRGAYIITGMMIVGAALAKVTKIEIGPRFLSLTILGKFIVWPALALAFIFIDRNYTHIYEDGIYNILLLLSFMPTAANVAAFAAQLDLIPEKAATAILIATLFAILYVPLALMVFGMG